MLPVFFSEQNISLLSAGTLGAEPCPKGYHSIVKKGACMRMLLRAFVFKSLQLSRAKVLV